MKNNSYIKFAACGFQLMVTILVFLFLGQKIDVFFHKNSHAFTVILTLLGFFGGIYKLFNDLKQSND